MLGLKKIFLILICMFLSSCGNDQDTKVLRFIVSADYPPFTMVKDGKITGFEIDLANAIAKKMGMSAKFQDIQFAGIPVTLQNNMADAAISAIAKTPSRGKNFDFSDVYYFSEDKMVVVVEKHSKEITSLEDLNGHKVVCQLGSVMEMWIKGAVNEKALDIKISTMDSVPQLIESVKSGQFKAAVIEVQQAESLTKNNEALVYYKIDAKNENGYRIMFKKGCVFIQKINQAISELKQDGTIKRLESKWFNF